MDADTPRLATLDDEGWTLEDAEARYARGDDLYWIPSRWEREHLDDRIEDGIFAKLIFLIRYPTAEGRQELQGERMWVEVTGREGEYYHGHLANEPYTKEGSAHEGMAVWFRAEHVIDFGPVEGAARASEQAATIACHSHGLSETCYVCEHLVGASGIGFHVADDPGRLRPDAWCDACEALVQEVDGDWDALGDRHPKLSVLCGGCYDVTRARNQCTGPSGST